MQRSALVLLRGCLLIGSAMLGLGGCSAIVGGPVDPGPLPCVLFEDGSDPCPGDDTCVEGFCAGSNFDACNGIDDDGDGIVDNGSPTEPPCMDDARCVMGACLSGCSNEICNHVDDDCDGNIDEGLNVDDDMDGVSACPVEGGGELDCDDTNSAVHPANPELGIPAAIEICNGLDDDCDPGTREDMVGRCGAGRVCQILPGEVVPECLDVGDCRLDLCAGNTICDAITHVCVDRPTDCMTMGCPSPLVCTDGVCVPPPLGGTGADCDTASDCTSGLCFPRASMRLTAGDHMGICGTACCSNSDCGSGERCWAPGTGARSCVTAAVYGDATAELCSLPSDCSGSCRDGSVTYSAGGVDGSFDGLLCGAARAISNPAYCPDTPLGRVSCTNGVCLSSDICAAPCQRTDDCASQYPSWFPGAEYSPICGLINSGSSVFTGCVSPGSGTRVSGQTCGSNADCRDEFCVSGRCADVCCSDSSCPADFRCAPIAAMVGGRPIWPMRCFPASTGPI